MSSIVLISSLIWIISSQTRFIMDDDNDLNKLQPFPIDVCFQSYTNPSIYTRYQCNNDGSMVFRKEWNSTSLNQCNTNTNGIITTIFNSSTSPSCGKGSFQCIGENNYLFQNIYPTNPSCNTSPTITLPIATGCFCDSDTSSIQVSCTNAYNGGINTYQNVNDCSNIPNTTDIGDCGLIDSYQIEPSTINTYATIESCTINGSTINKTPSPTTQTSAPTTSEPTQPTAAPIVFDTRFIIDDDWFLSENTPFPLDECLQTQPLSTTYNFNSEFIYYECSSNNDEIIKYKWTQTEIAGLSAPFDCNNKSIAQQTIITSDLHENEICNKYYFNCIGTDDYTTIYFEASEINTDCTISTSKFSLFATSIATDTCYCSNSSSAKSNIFSCDKTDGVTLTEYDGAINCDTSISSTPQSSIIAGNNECKTYSTNTINRINQTGITLNIFGTMQECVKDDVNIVSKSPTEIPSNIPSKAPSKFGDTAKPTYQPTSSPSYQPSGITIEPTMIPSKSPMETPTVDPTEMTDSPSIMPTKMPDVSPTSTPTLSPSEIPSGNPTTQIPSMSPSEIPTEDPTKDTMAPSNDPSSDPTSEKPTKSPNVYTRRPTDYTDECGWLELKVLVIIVYVCLLFV